MMIKKLLIIFLFSCSLYVTGQTREKAFLFNEKLGNGINYGNIFEAPTETEWGNPWQANYPKIVADLGFDHVRIPIRWEPAARSASTAPYTINPEFLARIKMVVDANLQQGLKVIINMHHHEALFDNPEGQKARFLAQWKQIAAYFKGYPENLVFEILNEPHGNLTAAKWNQFLVAALAEIRTDNPDRFVMIGTADWGGLGGLSQLSIPNDPNLILTIHYYNPFRFTHQGAEWVTDSQGWLGTEWLDSEDERATVERDFAPLLLLSKEKNIPVHIGEFGAYSKADLASRSRWTTYLSRYFEQNKWSSAYWEFSAGFGIYEPKTGTTNQTLVNALLHNPMPDPQQFNSTALYTSNFSQSKDGWELYVQGSGNGSTAVAGNALQVTINNGSSEAWHVQLVKNNIKLVKGKRYRLSFKMKAETNRQFSAYAGKSVSPWSAYSDVISTELTGTMTSYATTFVMAENDNAARLVFDLGKNAADVTVSDILLEELTPQSLAISTEKPGMNMPYPNPARDQLNYNNLSLFKQVLFYDIQGKLISSQELMGGQNRIDISGLPKGLYVLRFTGENARGSLKYLIQ